MASLRDEGSIRMSERDDRSLAGRPLPRSSPWWEKTAGGDRVRARLVGFAPLWCLVLFIAATVPHLVASFAPGRDGFGTIMFVNDFAQYEAAMAEGARSDSWLIHDHFTPE